MEEGVGYRVKGDYVMGWGVSSEGWLCNVGCWVSSEGWLCNRGGYRVKGGYVMAHRLGNII